MSRASAKPAKGSARSDRTTGSASDRLERARHHHHHHHQQHQHQQQRDRQVAEPQPIQLELDLKLEEVESRIKSILSQRESKWQEIAYLALQVREKSSYKPIFKSFTAWVNHIAVQCDRQPSLIWRYIKAASYYLQLQPVQPIETSSSLENEDENADGMLNQNLKIKNRDTNIVNCLHRPLKSQLLDIEEQLQGISAAPEALETLEKVQRTAPVEVFEKLKERVLCGKATVAQCRQIEREYRSTLPQSGRKTNRGRPVKGKEGSYQHLGSWKSPTLIIDTVAERVPPQNALALTSLSSSLTADEESEILPEFGVPITRSQSAVIMARSLGNNLVDWTCTCAGMRYPPRHYHDHAQVRVNWEEKRLIIDFLAVVRWSYKRPKDIFIVEIKSCMADFQMDEKWEKYLNFCHYFSFAISAGDVGLKEMLLAALPEYVGILVIDLEASIQSAIAYPVEVIRSPKRLEPASSSMVYETLYERVLGWSGSDEGLDVATYPADG